MYTVEDLVKAYELGRGEHGSFTDHVIIDEDFQHYHLVKMRYSDNRTWEENDWKDLFAVFTVSHIEYMEIESLLRQPVNQQNAKSLRSLILPGFVPFLIDEKSKEISFMRHCSTLHMNPFALKFPPFDERYFIHVEFQWLCRGENYITTNGQKTYKVSKLAS
tara:strand:- start:1640 stop:2125 length:486 start_codon:yes stop_codon:yes gene_type:complete